MFSAVPLSFRNINPHDRGDTIEDVLLEYLFLPAALWPQDTQEIQ